LGSLASYRVRARVRVRVRVHCPEL